MNVWLVQGAYWCRLAEGLEEVPEVEAKAQLMMPPTPILKDNNWPLLTVTKGFFENLAQGAALPSSPGLHEANFRALCQQQHDLLADTIKCVCPVPSAFAACMQKLLHTDKLCLLHPAKSTHRRTTDTHQHGLQHGEQAAAAT